eukprot:424780_1
MPQCPNGEILTVLFAIICTLLSAFALFVLCKYIKNTKVEKATKIVQRCGVVFLIASILAFLCNGTRMLFSCFGVSGYFYVLVYIVYIISGATQVYLLLLIYYLKLQFIFAATALALSKVTNVIYISLFVFLPIYVAFVIIIIIVANNMRAMFMATYFFLFIMIMSSLVILFIFKLIQVYKLSPETNNDQLVTAITKTTILTSISLSSTFMNFIGNAIFPSVGVAIQWVCHYFAVMDVLTNFVCIMMSYNAFRMYYVLLCPFCDSKCRVCCSRIVTKSNNDIKMMDKAVSESKPEDTTQTVSSTNTNASKNDVNNQENV